MPGNDSNTKLLAHCNGTDASTTFVDSSSSAWSMTANGTAQIDTAQSEFGGASGLFDGSTSYVVVGSSGADFKFLHGALDTSAFKFTIDFWVKRPDPTSASAMTIFATCPESAANVGVLIRFGSSRRIIAAIYRGNGANNVIEHLSPNNIYPNDSNWHHIAWTYDQSLGSSNSTFFVDGVNSSTGTKSGQTPSTNNATSTATFGDSPDGTSFYNGWVDELRISNKIRWTSNFTPPTVEYSNDPTSSSSNLRMSMLGIDLAWLHMYPFPDGAISAIDRQQIAYKYRGIVAQNVGGAGTPYRTLLGVGG